MAEDTLDSFVGVVVMIIFIIICGGIFLFILSKILVATCGCLPVVESIAK